MITILRNLWTTLKRFKLASIFNVASLSVAFAAFIIIITQVQYERAFDRSYDRSGDIYRVEIDVDFLDAGYVPFMSRPLAEQIAHSTPEIEAYTITPMPKEVYIKVESQDGSVIGYREKMRPVTAGIAEVFDFEIIEGTIDRLNEPDKVIIPLSLAQKMFGGEAATGNTIISDNANYIIGAVYQDFPANSSLENGIMYNLGDEDNDDAARANFLNNFLYNFFVLLNRNSSIEDVVSKVNKSCQELPQLGDSKIKLRLTALEDVYYQKDIQFDMAPKGNRVVTNILLTIAFLVIVIASINFVNFSTSLAPMRMKSVNTRKVLGSSNFILRLSFIMESLGTCILAFLLSLVWVDIFEEIGFSSMFISPVNLTESIDIICLTFALSLLVGVLAGLYPAFYMTSFAPALVLKGSFGMSLQGRRLRSLLIGFQFVISIGLITAAFFFHLQNNYVAHFENGIDRDRILFFPIKEDMSAKDKQVLKDELRKSHLIDEVAYADNSVGMTDFYALRTTVAGEESMTFHRLGASNIFPKMMGLKIIEGRDFSENDNSEDVMLVNRKAKEQYGIEVGDILMGGTVIGIMEDFNFKSLRHGIDPLILVPTSQTYGSPYMVAYVKYNGNANETIAHIKNSVAKLDPFYPVNINFYDSQFAQTYQKESRTTRQITFFSILAVLISLVGVFGLVIFETQYRRKEIGIRKVFGANITQVLSMFNRNFIVIILICFIISLPLSYIGVSMWLEGFAYRTPLYWWVFISAMLLVTIVTVFIVTIQSWRAATTNPVDSIKN